MTTGEQRNIYSTLYKGETIENICFSDDGNTLLITSQERCTEYNLLQDSTVCVACSGENERFVAGNYVHSEIEIAVVEHSCVSKPRVKPYCCYYKKVQRNNQYRFDKVWSYEMPTLEKTDFQYFLHGHNDLGALGSIDENGCQQYWVTKGFFLEENEATKKFFTPKCFKWQGNRKINTHKEFKPYDMVFVCHSSALENQYSCGRHGCSYIFLSEDMREAVFTKNRLQLFYCDDLKSLTYQSLEEGFEERTKKANQNAFWDFVVPQNRETLLGCYENYNLISINAKDNQLLNTVDYYPGISIFDCDFSNATLDEGARAIISANGKNE